MLQCCAALQCGAASVLHAFICSHRVYIHECKPTPCKLKRVKVAVLSFSRSLSLSFSFFLSAFSSVIRSVSLSFSHTLCSLFLFLAVRCRTCLCLCLSLLLSFPPPYLLSLDSYWVSYLDFRTLVSMALRIIAQIHFRIRMICTHIHRFICIHVYIHIYMYVYMLISIYLCMIHTYTRMHKRMQTRTHTLHKYYVHIHNNRGSTALRVVACHASELSWRDPGLAQQEAVNGKTPHLLPTR